MAVGDAYLFPGFLTPVLTQVFFPKPPTTFLTCFCRGERRKLGQFLSIEDYFSTFGAQAFVLGFGWLVLLRFNSTLTRRVISWRSMTHVFPGFLTPVLTQLFFPKPPTTFLTCFCRAERREYTGKKVRLNRVSNSQPSDHGSDTPTTELPRWGS